MTNTGRSPAHLPNYEVGRKILRPTKEMRLIRSASKHVALPAIPVEYAVLHYTVDDLPNALRILSEPSGPVSAHLLIAADGTVHELVSCWDGVAYRARHAGLSHWFEDGIQWDGFNEFSIGIEVVNRNGNVFPFTDAQYDALAASLTHLQLVYPALASPQRILGHEQISGWRGKVDPGQKFDWPRLFSKTYPLASPPTRIPSCPTELLLALNQFIAAAPPDDQIANNYWRALNLLLETNVALINRGERLNRRE